MTALAARGKAAAVTDEEPGYLPLRSRLLLASTVVQLVMLALLVWNGISVMEDRLNERTRVHLEEQKQLLSAALAVPLMQADRALMQEVLDRARRDQAMSYFVLFDRKNRIAAASGWDRKKPLPPRDASLTTRAAEEVFHTETEIRVAGERYGKVAVGVPTHFVQVARVELIRENLAVGVLALLVSTGIMVTVAYWLTRNLTRLTDASARLAAGDLSVRVPVHGRDEVAQLTAAFNTMAEALASRIAALAESRAKFTAIADYSYDCELWIDPHGTLIWVNPRVQEMFGYTPEQCLAVESFPIPFISPADLPRTVRQIRKALGGNTGRDFEFRARRRDGGEFWAAADWRPIYDESGAYQGIRVSIRDIAQRKEAERRLETTVTELRAAQAHERQTAEQLIFLAERDALTGLYNRHRFNEELARMMADAQRNASGLALLFFDLDDFKYINDTFGHRAGDAMLIRVAGEVAGQVRRNELFSRLGGDEFAILVPDISNEMLRVLAERITRSIATVRFQFEGANLRLTTSLGIAVYPDHADNAEDLIARSDMAMYQAKEAGKNAWRIYRTDLDTSVQMASRLSWNDRILHALENRLMMLHYQGIYSTTDGALSHFEVLVRMRDHDDPTRMLMPGQFIPMAEKSGKIVDIDRWVLRESIQRLADVKSIPALAVNISGRSFDEPTLPQYIAAELKRCGVSPNRLLVELTETSAVSDLHDAQRFIEALRQTGCGVCLDDFGTGFSSFAYLKHLQADAVKIDGLFIRNLPNEHDNQLFVRAIVSVAKGLHKQTIAECVEDEATLQMLKAFGVDSAQGYHLERPRGDHPLFASAAPIRNLQLPLVPVLAGN